MGLSGIKFCRTRVPFMDKCSGGEKNELWVEAANSLFGVFTDPDPEEQAQSAMDGLMLKWKK